MAIKLDLYENYQSEEEASPVPAEVKYYEMEVKYGEREPLEQDPGRRRRYLNALSKESSGNGVNLGGIFGGILKAVDVVAKRPQEQEQPKESKPNYTPLIIIAVAVAVAAFILKK